MIPPPILFLRRQKENGRWSCPREKTLARNLRVCASSLKYGGCSSGLPPILHSPAGARRSCSLESPSPACTPRRSSLVIIGKPALQSPLPLPWKREGQGIRNFQNPRPHHAAGRVFPDFYRTLPPRGVFFSWTVHGPFSFWQDQKENGGCIPAGKAGVVPRPAPVARKTSPRRVGAKNSRAFEARIPRAGSAPPKNPPLLTKVRIRTIIRTLRLN